MSVIVDIYGWDTAESALRAYVGAIAEAVGVAAESTCCTVSRSATAYIALDEHLPGFPDRDLALIWDDSHGWAAAIETHCGEDLIVVAYLGEDLVPPPRKVVAFRDGLVADRQPGQLEPPEFEPPEDLAEWLSRRVHVPAQRVP
ncbi:hypothetical protein FNH05_16490 [Amycolatopsis rhizosphaerae]|uniref:DUF6292 domain-containing protein n=1 Tax=Amycolatopsis rhizosphaerae TaxID=2053003 RepID=A0A558CMC1_9PSEU|nr:DUF6292 family protein [Amycolatopsis rhizosphaerae]TVT49904.1 hypothetical protein FNH05_16490 [Amycolatopsis rhizosphaerae]